jgi:choline monooxygenase
MAGLALDPSLVDPRGWEGQLTRVFGASWLGIPFVQFAGAGARPFVLEPLGVPLVETRDAAGETRVLSNVCTHRAAIVCEKESTRLRCPYHGRLFDLDGRALKAPGFGPEFPRDEDHLPVVPTAWWGPVRFLSLRPRSPFPREALEPWFRGVPLDGFTSEAPVSYEMPAHWALYCDNFLEGLHIPFVHPALQASVASYRIETFAGGSVQIAGARVDEPALALGPGHPLAGERLAALYFWIFPATMLNVYPWGISLNAVVPLAPDRTRVNFQSFVRDPSLRETGAGAGLHQVEMEDEAVVVSQQRGIRSPLYRPGRLAPAEAAVAHFHELLADAIRTPGDGAIGLP